MSFCRISKSSEPNNPSVSKPLFLQPRLQPNDIYEQEANTMADKVMRIPANENVFSKPASNIIQRNCSACEEEDKNVQMKGKTSTIGEFLPRLSCMKLLIPADNHWMLVPEVLWKQDLDMISAM